MAGKNLTKTIGSAAVFLAMLFSATGCSMEPADSEVRVEIQEKLSDAKKDRYVEKLKRLVDGGVKSTKTQSINGRVTIVIGPVSDVEAFAEKITFAKVVEVNAAERTIILSVRNI